MRVAEALRRDGLATLALDESAARAFVEGLGPILHETDVRLRPGAMTWLASPDPIPAHTDHPTVQWVAWWCVRQDNTDGASLLVDGRRVLGQLGAQADLLERVLLPVPGLKGVHPVGVHPMLAHGRVYWAPWLEPTVGDELRPAVDAFADLVRSPALERRVRLTPGDLLVIDNTRMLHGRGALVTGSVRHLKRWWVGCP